jgi:hypothetical protein
VALGHGGARAGAGRKANADKYARPISLAEGKIADKLPHIVDRMLELADGVYREQEMPDGAMLIYKTPPDRQAIQYLVDRIMGKPKEKSEQDVNLRGGVTILLPERKKADE